MSEGFTVYQKLHELHRELAMRRSVYPRFIAKGSLNKDDAAYQIAVMEAIAEDYAAQTARDELPFGKVEIIE